MVNIYLLLYKSKIPSDCVPHTCDELSCKNCSPICDINMPSLNCNTASEGLDSYLCGFLMSHFLVVWAAVMGEPCDDFSRDLAFSFSKALTIIVVSILTQAFSNQFNVTLEYEILFEFCVSWELFPSPSCVFSHKSSSLWPSRDFSFVKTMCWESNPEWGHRKSHT